MKKRWIVIASVLICMFLSTNVMAADMDLETGPRQDIEKDMMTGEVMLNETPATLEEQESGYTDGYIPDSVRPKTKEIIGSDDRTRITNTTTYPNSAIAYMEIKFPNDDDL